MRLLLHREVRIVAIVLTAGVVGLVGCTHLITTRERVASFEPYAALRIDGQPVRPFLLQRVAVLISGVDVTTRSGPNGQLEEITLGSTDTPHLAFGTATAIDRRGYLLTAAHCVTHEPVHLVTGQYENGMHVERARIVWRGSGGKGAPDLAVLKIAPSLASVFEWAADFNRGDAVLTAGLDYEKFGNFDSGFAAGIITKIDHAKSTPSPHTFVFHNSPLHGGDSGGPLCATSGKLVGINTGGGSASFVLFSMQVGRAERPDLSWLKNLIDEDFASNR